MGKLEVNRLTFIQEMECHSNQEIRISQPGCGYDHLHWLTVSFPVFLNFSITSLRQGSYIILLTSTAYHFSSQQQLSRLTTTVFQHLTLQLEQPRLDKMLFDLRKFFFQYH